MARRTRGRIPVFSLNHRIIRRVSREEAERMCAGDFPDAEWDAANQAVRLRLSQAPVDKGRFFQPNATICKSELEANAFAGLGFRDVHSRTTMLCEEKKRERLYKLHRPPEDFIERAVYKVKVWPEIGDTKAPRAAIGLRLPGLADPQQS